MGYCVISFIHIFRSFVWLAQTESSGLFLITSWRWPRLRYFGMIHIRISDLRSLDRIMENQVNRWILSQSGFVGSFNASWSELSRITDPDPDYPIGTCPKFGKKRAMYRRFDCIFPKQPRFQTNILSINQVFRRKSLTVSNIPEWVRNSFYGYSKTINDWIFYQSSDQNWIGEMQEYAKYINYSMDVFYFLKSIWKERNLCISWNRVEK